MKNISLFAAVAVFCFAMGFGFYTYDHFVHRPASDKTDEVIYEVPKGRSFSFIAKEMENIGLVKNAMLFSWYARLKGDANKVKVGEYAFKKNMFPSEVLGILKSGKSIGHPFTVSEGLNIFDISELYEKNGFGSGDEFLKACRDPKMIKSLLGELGITDNNGNLPTSLEGYLYPETYQITKFTTLKELLTEMVRNFNLNYEKIGAAEALPQMSKHQIMTLASIIEKETGAPEDRNKISSVFHNRLSKGMMLQTDPTILYGLSDLAGKNIISIRKEDILRPTKYNTYVIKGLPPGPISNPGKEAMHATLHPAETDYLYFVSQNDGHTAFSSTYEVHNKAVKHFQVNPKARQGKSWRDLKKKGRSR